MKPSQTECYYCKRLFEKGPVVKIIKGKRRVFCSEYCYVLHRHRVPGYDMERTYSVIAKSFQVPDFRELLKED
ncbi:MAG: hypothetical protein JRH06_06935 [Deltaproteobacteria bacterium]|nr:hypothetical protein [Deltaproteobacteria bacterium]MBW2137276.1 hypothetical protein [Deltaproteobacteria bacterium]